jgi:hypothetical protein
MEFPLLSLLRDVNTLLLFIIVCVKCILALRHACCSSSFCDNLLLASRQEYVLIMIGRCSGLEFDIRYCDSITINF